MTKLFLGIDGGGTKTDVLCTDEHGTEFGSGSSGPTNLTSTSVGAASFNLKEAIRQALEKAPAERELTAVVMGLAGLDTEQEFELAHRTFLEIIKLFGGTRLTLMNDSMIALANGTDNANAVILISGTGSICFGKNAAGETARTGGMDFLLTDQGSGYDIGRHVLREAVKSYDGRRSKTVLEQLVCEHFGIQSIEHVKNEVYNPPLSKIEVAELAQLCSRAYDAHDDAAVQIFKWAQAELVLLAATALTKLHLETTTTDLVLAGSVLNIPHVKEGLTRELRTQFQQLTCVFPEKPPMYGALKLARTEHAV